jgi:hypothetical protein
MYVCIVICLQIGDRSKLADHLTKIHGYKESIQKLEEAITEQHLKVFRVLVSYLFVFFFHFQPAGYRNT